MNTNIELLFNLNIDLDFLKKLKEYYYIPETKLELLNLGGFCYFVDKLVDTKNIYYKGILVKNENNFVFKNNFSISINEIIQKYHVFYKPKLNKMNKALQMINNIN
jgi:hypothetical protein